MKQVVNKLILLSAVFALVAIFSCSKKSSSNNTTTGGGGALFPFAVNNVWNYKLKVYDTATGLILDSTDFTLTITGQETVNGVSYYQFQNTVAPTTLELLTSTGTTTLGSVDSAYGITAYTFFVSGAGDSTQSVNSWPISVTANGTTCEGTDKLFAHYADTTLINLAGTVYTSSMKNIIESYDCSGNKLAANVYFIKQGVGIVRYSRYVYRPNGQFVLELAWVLESETLN